MGSKPRGKVALGQFPGGNGQNGDAGVGLGGREAVAQEAWKHFNLLAFQSLIAIIWPMNSKHHKTLQSLLADPVNGNIEWARIEALLVALGCRVIEGPGSAVTFEHQGRKASFHRPHPAKEALRYRIKAVRELIEKIGAAA